LAQKDCTSNAGRTRFTGTVVLEVFIMVFLLFMSIVPVLNAKETLPEETIEERKIQEHLKKNGTTSERIKKNGMKYHSKALLRKNSELTQPSG